MRCKDVGRKRRADRDEIIDAVGLVIGERGLDGLSIDAVAKAAGIGKTSVLYDFKSRDALLAAFVERRIRLHRQAVAALRQTYEHGPDATMRALVEYREGRPARDDLVPGLLVAAAANRNEGFRSFLQEAFTEEMDHVEAESANPDLSLLAYLALKGLMALECFGFCEIEEGRRQRAFAEIAKLMNFPGPVTVTPSESKSPDISRKSQVVP